MNSLVIQGKGISLMERALEDIFGKQEKEPLNHWPEDEERDLENLEIVCTHKFTAEDMKSRGIKIPERDIYFKCSECNGHNDKGCHFRPDYYGNNEED